MVKIIFICILLNGKDKHPKLWLICILHGTQSPGSYVHNLMAIVVIFKQTKLYDTVSSIADPLQSTNKYTTCTLDTVFCQINTQMHIETQFRQCNCLLERFSTREIRILATSDE